MPTSELFSNHFDRDIKILLARAKNDPRLKDSLYLPPTTSVNDPGFRKIFEAARLGFLNGAVPGKVVRSPKMDARREENLARRRSRRVKPALRLSELDQEHGEIYIPYTSHFPHSRMHGCPDDKLLVFPWRNALHLLTTPQQIWPVSWR